MNRKEQQMREDAKEAIIEILRGGYNEYYCDLLHEIYTDYYIVGRREAEEALKEYGIFKAIERVTDYERENFGKINTDLSDPEQLINMLFCIIAEEVLYELVEDIEILNDNFYSLATDEINTEILSEILKRQD